MRHYAEEPLTRQVVLQLLKDYRRPNDKIHELLRGGELLQVKRGIYVPGPQVPLPQPRGVLLANHLWGPSYVSQETALSHLGLIPERVYEISSVTLKGAKSYKTPVGRFSYAHAALPYYAFGIRRVQLTPRQAVLMASPEKAVCDKIILTSGVNLRSVRQTLDFLIEDLRIDVDQLRALQHSEIRSWIPDAPKSSSLTMLLKTLEQL
ncbi:hypothetical protein GCM10023184_28380 [Flaviaesturariibacter amylovorans]|uniref:Transcriptional regulator, AbiEi antitoxin, Type IV TA system n=2 Tax=Flaviaesturariibacter amylovorans TaxID=1084520 RepID=A0ABP8H4V5_9BACT